ncbi:unnamed protein product [Strongylus vulgaris]|uniref:Apple domain-containing protein n=1 Tax=Strongylus vulgaris TaxID=40348 RepID=A0A3P7INY8_STRVU|nr:unnamed protein product [Strongylus vulgaris]
MNVFYTDAVPVECADAQFIRADDSVLIGFARNVTLVETMEQCVEQCIKEQDCKSAMYFYEEGECITNTESALSKPSAFAREENEKVVYFQNGCLSKLQSHEDPSLTSAEPTENQDHVKEEEIEDTPELRGSGRDLSDTVVQLTATRFREATTSAGSFNMGTTSATHEKSSDEDDAEDATSAELTTTTAHTTTTSRQQPEVETATTAESSVETKLNKKGEKASYIKYKKHPKNFASKTAKLTDRVKQGESVITDEGGEPVEGQTSPFDKKKHLSIKPVFESAEKEKEDVEEYPTYFSEWSDWTPCTKGGERQIRRRKCLDLRRCLGALMQVRNCPAVLPEPAQSGPVESVRSVIEVPRIPEYDDADGNPEVRPSTVVQQAESVWSPWLGVCQHFASGQPCNSGEMIGFESRECIAKEPSMCEGPFFRYCTLPC